MSIQRGRHDVIYVIHHDGKSIGFAPDRKAIAMPPRQIDLRCDFLGVFHHDQTSFLLEMQVNGANLAAKNTVDRNAQSCRFAVHRSTTAYDKIRVPK